MALFKYRIYEIKRSKTLQKLNNISKYACGH